MIGGVNDMATKKPFKSVGKGGAWSLSAMLNIPKSENIPVSLLRKIKDAELGTTVKNPTNKGKKNIKVSRKLKQKAVFAFNAKTKFDK